MALGGEVIHIPSGCTGLCRPLKVGVDKPFRHCVYHMWEEWMIDMLNTNGKIREATHKEAAAWTAEVFWDMTGKNMQRNLWWKMGHD